MPMAPRRPGRAGLTTSIGHRALHRGNRSSEDPGLRWHVEPFTEVEDRGPHQDHYCYQRKYRQQVAVSLDVSTRSLKTHGLSSSAGDAEQFAIGLGGSIPKQLNDGCIHLVRAGLSEMARGEDSISS
jgi:hypothetical protein